MKLFLANNAKKLLAAVLTVPLLALHLHAFPHQKDFSFKDCEYKKVAIALPQNPSGQEIDAANLILKYLKKAFPKTDFFTTRNPKDAFLYKSVSLSRLPDAKKLSFFSHENTRTNVVSTRNGRIKILYSSSPVNAAGDFLRELGFEFYAPNDEIGTKLPPQDAKIKRGERIYAHGFASISLYPENLSSEAKIFARLNGNDAVLRGFSHNLSNIFTPEDMREFPEFKPTLKKYASRKYLQPKFNAENAADFATEKAEKIFAKNPQTNSFSIGINDSLNFDISIPYDIEAEDRFISGVDSISNAYYSFANEVAKKIKKSNPDKFIGLIAYLPTLRHPDFPLEKNIAPFLCIDSANFFDENFKNETIGILKSYANDGSKVRGICSYIYGAPYFVPRPVEEFEIEFIRIAKNLGFNCYFAELNPVWAYDSFKYWAIQKVLNGSEKSCRELRLEYFINYYQGAGGAAMEFFDAAKSAWENRTDSPKWLGLFMRDTVAELFTPDILEKMEFSLQNAEADAKLPETKMKVAELRLEFEKTKAFVEDYFAKKELFFLKFKNAKSSEIIGALEKSKNASSKFEILAKKKSALFKNSPRNAKERSFSPPCGELLMSALKNATPLEIEKIKSLSENFNALKKASESKSELVFAFSPENFIGANDLENALGNDFIIKYIPSDKPELKIEKNGNDFALKVSNAFHFEFFKSLKLAPEEVYEINFCIDYLREISSEMFLAVSVFNAKNKCVKYKEVSIPPLPERRSDTFKIILETPANANRTVFGIYLRQSSNPVFIKKIEVRKFAKP